MMIGSIFSSYLLRRELSLSCSSFLKLVRMGDFKHNPINVLHKYFDGFLYWANWGAPRLALRFPHGTLPADLIDGYDYGQEPHA
jgi:hypothetical protein